MLLFKLLAILFLPIVIGAILPRRLSGLALGCIALLAALALLDERNIPIEDRDSIDAFIGHFLVEAWLGLAGAAFLLRIILGAWRNDGTRPPIPGKLHERLLAWPLPIGVLLAICLMHWLSNRLAGMGPAWAVHLQLIGVAAAALVVALRAKWPRAFPDLRTLAVVATATCALLVVKAANEARQWEALARRTAGERPYCLLTFAGREHVREAKQTLELSPLLSRSGGRSFVEDRPFLIVVESAGPREKGWIERHGGHWTDGPAVLPLACTPRINGSIA